MKLCFKKSLYAKIALFKAAYAYTESFYVHIDEDDENYIVNLYEKENGCGVPDEIEKQFLNEMLCQNLRHLVYQDTHSLREMLAARAIGSSVLYDPEHEASSEPIDEVPAYSAEDILKDWFDND